MVTTIILPLLISRIITQIYGEVNHPHLGDSKAGGTYEASRREYFVIVRMECSLKKKSKIDVPTFVWTSWQGGAELCIEIRWIR